MAIDLTSLVSDYLTPQLVGQIAAAAGVDPKMAQNLIDGAVPAVVGALGSAASAPGGAKKIADAISNADPDLLTKLSSGLASGKSDTLTAGANALSGILGSSTLWSLSGAIGQFAGVPHAAAQSTVGAVSQAVIGVIGQQDPSSWSDPGAIGSLLSSQKDIVSAALPSGLSSLLSSSGLLSGMGAAAAGMAASAAGAATSAASSAARSAQGAAANVASSASNAASSASNAASSALSQARAPSSSGGLPMWLVIVIAIVILAALYFYFSAPKETKPAATGSAAIEYALGRDLNIL
jgi:Bacterial protein of unknown function (DUF937)